MIFLQDFIQSMKMAMELKGFAKSTQRTYLAHLTRYAEFCGKHPAFYENKVVLSAVLGPFQELLDSLYAKSWVVYCKKPFKSPFYVVQYLSRYSHKTAIYNNRLVSMDENSVAFRYRDYRDNKVKLLKLDAMEFMRRFMVHVLPSGFQKIRYFGFLSNCNRKTKLLKCLRLNRSPVKPKLKLSAKELILKVDPSAITFKN